MARQFTSYINALNLSYEEELQGQGYFGELASFFKNNQISLMNYIQTDILLFENPFHFCLC